MSATCCSPSTSGRSRSPSKVPRPRSRATRRRSIIAELQVQRGASLISSRTITDAEYDQRKANLAVARAQLKAAEAGLRNAELNLDWTDVRAPIAGRISDRKVDAGNLVQGGQQGATLLATIVTLDPIHFVFDVSESDYLRYTRLFLSGALAVVARSVEPGAHPAGRRDRMDAHRQGRLRRQHAERRVPAPSAGRAVVENKDQLLTPGIFGRVQLFGGEYDALLIPDAAIVSDQARKIVFTVGDGQRRAGQARDPGTAGRRAARRARRAWRPTDKVVIDGLANPMVRPGAKVVPQKGEINAAKAK